MKLWLLVILAVLMLTGCFLTEWARSEGGQKTLKGVKGGAEFVKDAAPLAGPFSPIVAWLAGAVASGAGALAELGRRRNKKALVSVVSGIGSLNLDKSLLSVLGEHQNTAGTRVYIRKVVKKVNGGG